MRASTTPDATSGTAISRRRMERTDSLPRFFRHLVPSASLSPDGEPEPDRRVRFLRLVGRAGAPFPQACGKAATSIGGPITRHASALARRRTERASRPEHPLTRRQPRRPCRAPRYGTAADALARRRTERASHQEHPLTRRQPRRPCRAPRYGTAADALARRRTERASHQEHPLTRRQPRRPCRAPRYGTAADALADPKTINSVEGVAAGAGALRVGVVDREALLLDRVLEVDRWHRRGTGRSCGPTTTSTPSKATVASPSMEPLVEVELVDEAGAASGLDGETEAEVVTTLLLEQALHLRPRSP